MTEIGELAWWAALLLACWGAVAAFVASRGGARAAAFGASAERALEATAGLLVLATAGVYAYLRAGDLNFAWTAEATTANLPRVWRLAALLSRDGGSLMVAAAFTAILGAIAARGARATPRLAGLLCASVFAAGAWAAIADPPYARVATISRDGAGLSPLWQMPWTPIARILGIAFLSVAVVGAVHRLLRVPARRWGLAAMAIGAIAFAAAARQVVDGARSSSLDVFVAVCAVVILQRPFARIPKRILQAAGAIAVIALSGTMLDSHESIPLGGTAPATARGPFGATWTLSSDGISVYDELNRHVTAVLVDVRHGGSRAGVARAEWRNYVDASGAPLGDGVPRDAVLAGVGTYATIGLAMPPASEDVVLNVRFFPLFACWWLAAALVVVAAVLAAREPEA